MLNKQVEEVVNIMSENVSTMIERDVNLSNLDKRSGALKDEASHFTNLTSKFKKRYWWKNPKMMAVMGVVAILIMVIIIVKAVPKEDRRSAMYQDSSGGESRRRN
ncbi:Vesicle-associated membrane protein 2 [Blattella germanica]|nr:Vesicle-associated membrane protein 2 [Blattella germanica]